MSASSSRTSSLAERDSTSPRQRRWCSTISTGCQPTTGRPRTAYRIGQTRTVNVTYFVARDTIDDFVQAVLETKAALVNAIVEGDALAPGSGGDVVDELQRVLHAISAGDGVAAGPADADAWIPHLLHRASEEFRTMHRAAPHRPAAIRGEREVQALARALEALVKVLSGPSARRFRISSTSHTGVDYEIVVADADVTCSCPGFEYRGQCRHARDVKAALAAGEPCRRGIRRCARCRPE